MELAHWNIWELLTFKTNSYRKNFDLLIKDENIITEYTGTISLVRLKEKLPPLPIGEYSFSIWNFEIGKKVNADVHGLIKTYGEDNLYVEIIDMIKNDKFKTKDYHKIVFVHNLILRPEYRKKEITEEFIEFLYRDYFDDDVGIIAFVKPVQDNVIDMKFYQDNKTIRVRKTINSMEFDEILAYEYYGIEGLTEKDDTEINEYKMFSIAAKCGFSRINDSHLFIYSPEKTIERIEAKQKIIQEVEEVSNKK